ncbi:MAG TPA: DUF3040 domain-containing protein [Mycobacteriales bacterium]|nr:DUF3040 domain-containing protein [Mycobacteriales bacterium]
MPLSEHEQRALEQIERALYAEDPKFAHSWRARADVRSVRRARVVRGIAAVIVGLGLLLSGVVVQGDSTTIGIVLGVVGFLLMLGGAWLALSTRQRPAVAVPGTASAHRGPKVSIRERLSDRFQQRRDSGNSF